MSFEYPFAVEAIKLIAVISRITAFVMAFPFFNSKVISMKFKIAFIVMISIIMMPLLPKSWDNAAILKNLDMYKLFFLLLNEIVLGLTIALFVMLLFGIFTFGGSIIDRDAGLMMSRLVDPVSSVNTTLMSNIMTQMFVILFLIMNGHQEVLRIAAASFETLPPGAFMIDDHLVNICIELGTNMFVMGFRIAIPIFGVMLLINVSLALMARVGQDFPVLMLSFPLRLMVGILMMVTLIPILMTMARTIQGQTYEWLAYLVNLEL